MKASIRFVFAAIALVWTAEVVQARQLVIHAGHIKIAADLSHGGAIGNMYWQGFQEVDTFDNGRWFQPSVQYYTASGQHVEEDLAGGQRSVNTRILSARLLNSASFTLTARPTLYYGGATSRDVVETETVTIGWMGMPNVIDYALTAKIAPGYYAGSFIEVPALYLGAGFGSYADIVHGRLNQLGHASFTQNGVTVKSPILAYDESKRAVGLFTAPSRRLEYYGGFNFTSVNKLNAVFHFKPGAVNHYDVKIVVGNLRTVISDMRRLAGYPTTATVAAKKQGSAGHGGSKAGSSGSKAGAGASKAGSSGSKAGAGASKAGSH